MRKASELKDAATAIFKDKHLITNQNLMKAVMEHLDVKERTARAYIKSTASKKSLKEAPEIPRNTSFLPCHSNNIPMVLQ
jgi:hypothetical protein